MNPVDYETYHDISCAAGDCDPAYTSLRYLCDRFELNEEQRYWLAFLYATCYCGATVFFAYNEFPDAENVHMGRLERWWRDHRSALVFQSDRRWLRSRNQWCATVGAYLSRCKAAGGQAALFARYRSSSPAASYDAAFEDLGKLYQFGRYSLFLWLEAVHVVTGFPFHPRSMDMADSSSESSRNGLCYALGRPDLSTHGTDRKLDKATMSSLQKHFDALARRKYAADPADTVWSLETTLCAYKKYRIGKRYVGYYLDREAKEIAALQAAVPHGVCWDVLWQYREESYDPTWLAERRTK